MTEDEARSLIAGLTHVPRETWHALDTLAKLVKDEAAQHNLVASSTVDHIWSRHILDSAQLLAWAPSGERWLDLGTGAGFPGLVVAAFRPWPMTLVEPRKLRADFLQRAIDAMGLGNRTTVHCARVESLAPDAHGIISARAVASLEQLLGLAHVHQHKSTVWLLPKGRTAASEVAAARRTWQGTFRIEPSMTDPDAGIVIAENVQPKAGAGSKR